MTEGSVATCPVAHDFDPLAPAHLADPYPELNGLRAAAPVRYLPSIGYWLVTRHADVSEIFADPGTFSA